MGKNRFNWMSSQILHPIKYKLGILHYLLKVGDIFYNRNVGWVSAA